MILPFRVSPRIFVAGTLVGALLLVLGGTATALLHPHFAQRVRQALLPTDTPIDASFGSLSDVLVTVDTSGDGTPISPFIYGVAGADAKTLEALGATVDRWGGNPSSSYNWANGHAWNAGRDWEFRNGNYGFPQGSAADHFVGSALSAGAVPLITIPSIGWVAKNDDNQTRSIGVPAHGGPPMTAGSETIAGYDPNGNRLATSVRSLPTKPGPFVLDPPATETVVYQDEWVHELVTRFGAAPSGARFFTIDNEPDLWSSTHTDVHPVRMSYADMLSMYEQYAVAVKHQDPGAMLLGPDVSGWTGYWFSDLDRGSDNFATHADRSAHGGEPFLPWWLGQVAKADRAAGSRSLDLLDIHYYPQAGGVYSSNSDPATQALRIRSIKSLYDPNYVDESWIGTQVDLIPRMQQWIAQQYPGTGLAITEYNWGGEHDASGAVALAEVLGTFGRLGVTLAVYWTFPPVDSPAGAAFRLFRNYNGTGGKFGDVSVPVQVSASGIAAYAAKHTDRGEYDVVLTNEDPKRTASVKLDLGVDNSWSATQWLIPQGSSQILPRPIDMSRTIQLPPYSVSLITAMQR